MMKSWRIPNTLLLAGIFGLCFHLTFETARSRRVFRTDGSTTFVRGDTNGDDQIDIADPIFTLNFLFGGGDTPECMAAADVNDDAAIDVADPVYTLNFLFGGGRAPPPPYPDADADPTPDLGCREDPLPPLSEVGTLGGPDRELTEAEALLWRRGRQLFDHPFGYGEGLGPMFNGDSCRGCHLDPVLGGAGRLDLNVVRFAGYDDDTGTVYSLPGGPAASRHTILDIPREEKHPDVRVVETRQTPALFGLGLVDRLPDEVLLANADPDDADGDGISGRARMVNGIAGRFGHKAGVPSLLDFAADAMINELGITVSSELSPFAVESDADDVPDPELSDEETAELAFFLAHLAPPPRNIPASPAAQELIAEGEQHFRDVGCAKCHVETLVGDDGPVHAYSDFLLHDVADPTKHQVNEDTVYPREYRTAPLWGTVATPPYMHDGSAETYEEAILQHFGEAEDVKAAYVALPPLAKTALKEFLRSL